MKQLITYVNVRLWRTKNLVCLCSVMNIAGSNEAVKINLVTVDSFGWVDTLHVSMLNYTTNGIQQVFYISRFLQRNAAYTLT